MVHQFLNFSYQFLSYQFIRLSIHQVISSSGYQFIRLSVHQVISSSGYQFIRLPVHQVISSSGYQFIRLSVHQVISSSGYQFLNDDVLRDALLFRARDVLRARVPGGVLGDDLVRARAPDGAPDDAPDGAPGDDLRAFLRDGVPSLKNSSSLSAADDVNSNVIVIFR
jgi:hypothetical protein